MQKVAKKFLFPSGSIGIWIKIHLNPNARILGYATKRGADVGSMSAFVLPMVGTMTIITAFLYPYVVKFG
jgi:hypothetical protein